MKAVVLTPGPMLVNDHSAPSPTGGEALVRVRLCGICNTDLELAKGYMNFKGIPGHEFVGEVVEVNLTDNGPSLNEINSFAPSGSRNEIKADSLNDTNYKTSIKGKSAQASTGTTARTSAAEQREDTEVSSIIGRRVVGEINAACGECAYCAEGVTTHCQNRTVLGILGRDGCMAEYFTLPLENLHVIPDNISDEAAVFIEPIAAAFQILEQVDITKGQRVAVMGDGKLGLLCAMVLSTTGADVTLMGRHKRKMALVESYGVKVMLSGDRGSAGPYDVVVEATGSASGFEQAMTLTRPRGIIVLKSTVAEGKPLNLAPIVINEITVVGSRCGPFEPAIEALASGAIDPTPLIEDTWPIDDAIKAFEHASKKGTMKVLVSF